MLKIILTVLLAEIFNAAGHILFKMSTNSVEKYSLRGMSNNVRFVRDVLSQPSIWAGIFAMAMGLVVWIVALAQGDLSLVFPLGSMQYIIILFSAHFFLGEKIDTMKTLGTFLVVLGILLITVS